MLPVIRQDRRNLIVSDKMGSWSDATRTRLAFLFLSVLVSVVPTASHRPPRDLSDEVHYEGDGTGNVHNLQYDHEAFLGVEEAKTFDELPPAEAKRRLGIIVDKIDVDKNGEVTEEELVAWVRHVARR
jgi:hypothetical protein